MLLNCFVIFMAVSIRTSSVKTVHVTKSTWVFGKQFCEIQDDRLLLSHEAPGIQGRSVSKNTGGREFVKA